jgi:hypothetical protein
MLLPVQALDSNPPMSTSRVAGITVVPHHIWSLELVSKTKIKALNSQYLLQAKTIL